MMKEMIFAGAREVDFDEDDNDPYYQLEGVVPKYTLQNQVENTLSSLAENYLSTHVTSFVYSGTSTTSDPDDFDKINGERDQLLINIIEHVKYHKAQREFILQRVHKSKKNVADNFS